MKPASDIIKPYDADSHFSRVRALYDSYRFTNAEECSRHLLGLLTETVGNDTTHTERAFSLLFAVTMKERYYLPFDLPARNADNLKRALEGCEQTLERLKATEEKFSEWLVALVRYLLNLIPQPGPGQLVPLCDLIDWRKRISDTVAILRLTHEGHAVFPVYASIIEGNLPIRKKEAVFPENFDGTPSEAVETYLKGTPFKDLLMMPVPFSIDDNTRFSHAWALGSSGSGKTTLLEKLIVDDLEREDRPAIIIIDPKGTMADRLSRLSIMNDRNVVLLDPATRPPQFNIFAQELRGNAKQRQEMANTLIGLFAYMFDTGEASSKLTDRMLSAFGYACRLMMAMPNANIKTLLELLNEDKKTTYDTSRFRPHIERLSPASRLFFEQQFFTVYGDTKKLIADRIFGLLQFPIFEQMLMADICEISMFDVLQQGKTCIISSPIAVLGKGGSQLFSRMIVSLVTMAALSRSTVPKSTWRPAFFYIDEAQTVYDEVKTQELFQLVREFRVGVTVANQQIRGQLPDAVYSTLSANTGIKYCATRSYDDAAKMSHDMRCSPDFILNQKISDGNAHFACYVDGKLPHPISVSVELGGIHKQPQMTDEEHEAFLERCMPSEPEAPPAIETHDAPTEAEASRAIAVAPAEKPADVPSVPQQDDTPPSDDIGTAW